MDVICIGGAAWDQGCTDPNLHGPVRLADIVGNIKQVFHGFFFEKGKDSKTYCSNSQGISGDIAELDFCSYGEQKARLIPNENLR